MDNFDHTPTIQQQLSASITVEIVPPAKYQQESVIISTETARNMLKEIEDDPEKMEVATGVHFLSDEDNKAEGTDYDKKKNELLEYLTRHDGSVVCKLCGEVLASRTHWYRHKYKLHVNNLVNPAPLFKCTYCNVFFKSRKGYMGHISARHSNENSENVEELSVVVKEEVVETEPSKIPKKNKDPKSADWDEQREKEEKLVADIISRVRKECEAQGAVVSRRGYSRRSTVMMNSS